MAENMLDNAKVAEAGMPRFKRDFFDFAKKYFDLEKFRGKLVHARDMISDAKDKYWNDEERRNRFHSHLGNTQDLINIVCDLMQYVRNGALKGRLAKNFGIDNPYDFNDMSLYELPKRLGWTPDFSWITNPGRGQENVLKTAKALSDVYTLTDKMKSNYNFMHDLDTPFMNRLNSDVVSILMDGTFGLSTDEAVHYLGKQMVSDPLQGPIGLNGKIIDVPFWADIPLVKYNRTGR